MKIEPIFNDILKERERQNTLWGEQNHSPIEWIAILGEEFGELSKEALELHFQNKFGNPTPESNSEKLSKYRQELIQVAAVAVQMLECLDRNT